MPGNNHEITRRHFIKLTAGAGAGLSLGVSLSACSGDTQDSDFHPNLWVKIDTNGTIRVVLTKTEMGQGVATALPMLVAEELEVPLHSIIVEQAPLTPEYGYQSTGGSRSVREAWQPLREAGASAREMLREAARRRWDVPLAQCRANQGRIINQVTADSLSYGELAAAAAMLPIPSSVTLKPSTEFKIIGSDRKPAGAAAMVTGETIYGIDVRLPGLQVAALEHCPYYGGSLGSYDSTDALASPGVTAVIPLKDAIAVVADNYWHAEQALKILKRQWVRGDGAAISSESLFNHLSGVLDGEGTVHRSDGDALRVIATASTERRVALEFKLPFQAHVPLEPMNCVAWVKDGGVELWVPTQNPSGAQQAAYEALYDGNPPIWQRLETKLLNGAIDAVKVNVTDIGGAFGRRLSSDYVTQAVKIARHVKGPVKLIWSRKEDIQHDRFHPAGVHRLQASLTNDGRIEAWSHRFACARARPAGASDLPYSIPNIFVESIEDDPGVPVGAWRAVSHVYNSFVTESFIDDLAATVGKDPVEYRRSLLRGSPRLLKVLDLAAGRARWGDSLPVGHFQGIAVHEGFGSYIAHVVEVSISQGSQVRVHKVTSALDCGQAINPDGVRAQVEGAIAFGLTAALKSAISIQDSQARQSNFHNHPILDMGDMPAVEIHLVDSSAAPGGVGEIGVPPITAAVANAVFAATGIRHTTMPFGRVAALPEA